MKNNTIDLDGLELQCRKYGKRHSTLKPDTFEHVVESEPTLKTEEMRAWAWAGYRQARILRGGF